MEKNDFKFALDPRVEWNKRNMNLRKQFHRPIDSILIYLRLTEE